MKRFLTLASLAVISSTVSGMKQPFNISHTEESLNKQEIALNERKESIDTQKDKVLNELFYKLMKEDIKFFLHEYKNKNIWAEKDYSQYVKAKNDEIKQLEKSFTEYTNNFGTKQRRIIDILLYFSVCSDRLDILKYVVEHGADINKKDEKGRSPLFYALARECEETAKYLLKNGSDMNEQFRNGYSPLIYAIFKGKPGFLDFLLNVGVDVNRKNAYDCTPLFLVKTEIRCIKRYMEREKNEALEKAMSHFTNIEGTLLSHGAKVNHEIVTSSITFHSTKSGVMVKDKCGVIAIYKNEQDFKKAGGYSNVKEIIKEKRNDDIKTFGGTVCAWEEIVKNEQLKAFLLLRFSH